MGCVVAAGVILPLIAGNASAGFTELVIFGDSLSDAGNDLVLLGVPAAPTYFDGRFSDGPVWVDQLATQLGIPVAVASQAPANGNNYAYGGAETGPGFDTNFGVIPNMGMQIDEYLITDGKVPNPNQLFVLLGGHNNFRNDVINAIVSDPNDPVADMVDHITTLANAGATTFLVSTLMPVGQLPESLGGPNEVALDAFTVQFNTLLGPALDQLRTDLGVTIFEFDTFSVMQDMLTNPAAFGLTNVTDPAFDGGYDGVGTIVPNPEEYLFFDTVHPTTVAHGFIADAAVAALPVPADRDADGDVDAVDFSVFFSCFNKAGNPPRTSGCDPDDQDAFDFDDDNDVDALDFDKFFSCFNKAGNPPRTLNCPQN